MVICLGCLNLCASGRRQVVKSFKSSSRQAESVEAVEAVEAVKQSCPPKLVEVVEFRESDVRKKLSHADGQGVGGLHYYYQ